METQDKKMPRMTGCEELELTCSCCGGPRKPDGKCQGGLCEACANYAVGPLGPPELWGES